MSFWTNLDEYNYRAHEQPLNLSCSNKNSQKAALPYPSPASSSSSQLSPGSSFEKPQSAFTEVRSSSSARLTDQAIQNSQLSAKASTIIPRLKLPTASPSAPTQMRRSDYSISQLLPESSSSLNVSYSTYPDIIPCPPGVIRPIVHSQFSPRLASSSPPTVYAEAIPSAQASPTLSVSSSSRVSSSSSRPFKLLTSTPVEDPEYIAYRDMMLNMLEARNGSLTVTNPRMRRSVHRAGGAPEDEQYKRGREKNNAAAKRSRDLRKLKEKELNIRVSYLEHQNRQLCEQLAAAERAGLCVRCSRY